MITRRIRMAHGDPWNLHRPKVHKLEERDDDLKPERVFSAHTLRKRECDVQIAVPVNQLTELLSGIVTAEDDKSAAYGLRAVT
ncbi:hypothetical protein BMI87_17495 [Thioclava sp. F28-4]|nr:hypothetical protein BMI87_17495 [Thioclava sp. F28-4]